MGQITVFSRPKRRRRWSGEKVAGDLLAWHLRCRGRAAHDVSTP